MRGFEPPTPWSRTKCATRLRYTPIKGTDRIEEALCRDVVKYLFYDRSGKEFGGEGWEKEARVRIQESGENTLPMGKIISTTVFKVTTHEKPNSPFLPFSFLMVFSLLTADY